MPATSSDWSKLSKVPLDASASLCIRNEFVCDAAPRFTASSLGHSGLDRSR
jgi:hypothetical protein